MSCSEPASSAVSLPLSCACGNDATPVAPQDVLPVVEDLDLEALGPSITPSAALLCSMHGVDCLEWLLRALLVLNTALQYSQVHHPMVPNVVNKIARACSDCREGWPRLQNEVARVLKLGATVEKYEDVINC